MNEAFIIDAHAHVGLSGIFFQPANGPEELLRTMDRVSVRQAIVAGDQVSVFGGAQAGIAGLRRVYEESQGRLWYLGVFDPRTAAECLRVLKEAVSWPGFAGLKVHPSVHHTCARGSGLRARLAFCGRP